MTNATLRAPPLLLAILALIALPLVVAIAVLGAAVLLVGLLAMRVRRALAPAFGSAAGAMGRLRTSLGRPARDREGRENVRVVTPEVRAARSRVTPAEGLREDPATASDSR